MKPAEITKEEFYSIRKALTKKMRELYKVFSKKKGFHYNKTVFFSDREEPCIYDYPWNILPKEFKLRPIKGHTILHFLNFGCHCEENVTNKHQPISNWPICLTRKREGNRVRYFLAVHTIGNCPFKVV